MYRHFGIRYTKTNCENQRGKLLFTQATDHSLIKERKKEEKEEKSKKKRQKEEKLRWA